MSRQMQKRVRLVDVAAHAGVAPSSVSRVLSNHADVSEETHAKVMAAVEELGYRPNQLARSMRTGATKTIGYLIADVRNPMFSAIAYSAEAVLADAGYTLMLTSADGSAERESMAIARLLEQQVDGLLLSMSAESGEALTKLVDQTDRPAVLLDRETSVSSAGMVQFDQEGLRKAVLHLKELGHRSLALVNGPSTLRPYRERERVVRTLAAEHGLELEIAEGDSTAVHGEAATRRILSGANAPTALIAGSSQMFEGVVRGLMDMGINFPEDISLVTHDVLALQHAIRPQMATIQRDMDAFGRTAALMILDLLEGGEASAVSCATDFDPGASCGPPRKHELAHKQTSSTKEA